MQCCVHLQDFSATGRRESFVRLGFRRKSTEAGAIRLLASPTNEGDCGAAATFLGFGSGGSRESSVSLDPPFCPCFFDTFVIRGCTMRPTPPLVRKMIRNNSNINDNHVFENYVALDRMPFQSPLTSLSLLLTASALLLSLRNAVVPRLRITNSSSERTWTLRLTAKPTGLLSSLWWLSLRAVGAHQRFAH